MKKVSYILLIIFVFLISIVNTNALPETKNREELDNLGVNKKWKITDDNRDNVLNTKYVDADQKVYDFSEVLTEEEIEQLKASAQEFKNKTKMEIIILVDNLPYRNDKENEDYSADFYDYNDFGLDLDKYSGVLLFRNTYEEDPYYDIYTFGNAQLYFSYNRLENVLDNIYDDLHNGNYYSGFNSYIRYMSNYYSDGIPKEMENYEVDEDGYLHELPAKYHPPILIALIISTIVSGIIVGRMISKNKMVMKATSADEYIDSSSINITQKEDRFINSHTTHYTVSSSSSSGGGGGSFHSSGGSSGGGHSSGGGRHG